MKKAEPLRIFTDGSCHVSSKLGAWGAILLFEEGEVILSDLIEQTTHNRMELIAVIKAIEYVKNQNIEWPMIQIYSDSQYVVEIPNRKAKLLKNDFKNKAGKALNNEDLLRALINHLDSQAIQLIKVKSHQKKGARINYNRKIDQWVRKLLREQVAKKARS